MSFDHLGLMPQLLHAVEASGYTEPTPIQDSAIPAILQGKDVLGGAQTGTGKTAAFALPVLQILHKQQRHERRPRTLVLSPTRELAAQVDQSFIDYGKYLRLRSTVIFGGVGQQPQVDRLRQGVDILVACPGRLLDLSGQGKLDLSAVEILILDEADRMLDMGFIHDIRRILKLLPAERQNLLFSATYSKDIRQLANSVLNRPAMIEVDNGRTAAETVQHAAYPVSQTQKRHLLAHLIEEGDWSRVLVFTRTKHGANRLAGQLFKDGINAAAIHGNKSQSARTKALADFKAESTRVLVATDIAARGLDISGLPHVVNFDLPHVPEDYIHRIGRTGRAGASGDAVSLVTRDDLPLFRAIEKLLGSPIPVKAAESFNADFALETRAPQRPRSEPRQDQASRGESPKPGNRSRSRRRNRNRRPRDAQVNARA